MVGIWEGVSQLHKKSEILRNLRLFLSAFLVRGDDETRGVSDYIYPESSFLSYPAQTTNTILDSLLSWDGTNLSYYFTKLLSSTMRVSIMAKLTPEQIADKQVKKSAAAVQDYKDGVNAVTVSPTAKAASKVTKYAAGVQRAVDDGSFVDGCNSVSLQDWQQAAANKGARNYAAGVNDAKVKIADFQRAIQPHRDALKASLDAMPDDTIEDRLAKMEANARGMAKFKYRKARR